MLWNDPKLFPKIIIVMYLLSSVNYARFRDWGHCLYWFAAILITISVTFLIKH
jgi:hypothetical protein